CHPLSALCASFAPFAVNLLVPPAQVGVQGGMHQSRLRPWIPDQVRDDAVLVKCILTLRSAASRRVCLLTALHLQPLLRDGAIAPPQDESGAEGQKRRVIPSALFAPPSRPSRLIFSSLPRRWESRAAE
ncbi:MAG: hypothetical protein CMM78_11205, partial [Rhodospirillaceae bacterium]|nr:hypothetical protein [Rhodospirillaceae bacterium]